ncbi:MAG TPA: hypothetical protein DEA82_11675, partial [Flavobacteriaceae bacterium]|nr:hypothetical protein [Flavobacteriaceae bacterium]
VAGSTAMIEKVSCEYPVIVSKPTRAKRYIFFITFKFLLKIAKICNRLELQLSATFLQLGFFFW